MSLSSHSIESCVVRSVKRKSIATWLPIRSHAVGALQFLSHESVFAPTDGLTRDAAVRSVQVPQTKDELIRELQARRVQEEADVAAKKKAEEKRLLVSENNNVLRCTCVAHPLGGEVHVEENNGPTVRCIDDRQWHGEPVVR